MAQETLSAAENPAVMNQAIDAMKHGRSGEFFQQLWADHQHEVIALGKHLLMAVIVIILAWLAAKLVRKMILKATGKIAKLDEAVGKILAGIAKAMIWTFAALIILDLFGINTASILTVLGAAGLAVGLAMKDSLSNIAAGVMLILLRPYKLGDFVDSGTVTGVIKEIGLFSTTLMTVDGIYVSAPNSVIFGNPIKNYSRNPLRRADITVSISYGDSLSKGVEILRELMNQNESIIKEPAPEVLVAELADSSVNLTLRFWATTENYWKAYWAIKSQLKPTLEAAGLNIPFPQRVLTFANAIPEKTK